MEHLEPLEWESICPPWHPPCEHQLLAPRLPLPRHSAYRQALCYSVPQLSFTVDSQRVVIIGILVIAFLKLILENLTLDLSYH